VARHRTGLFYASLVSHELSLIPNPINIPNYAYKNPTLEELPDSPTVFANFLTFVVDKILLLRNQSATKPLATVMIHETKKGIPDKRPFYNTTAGARTPGNINAQNAANVISYDDFFPVADPGMSGMPY